MANPFEITNINPLQALLMQRQGADDAFEAQLRPLKVREQQGKLRARDQLSQMLQGGGAPDYGRLAIGMLAAGDPTGAGVLANLVNQQSQRAMQERQIEINERLAGQRDIPSGFERAPGGGLRAIPGGPGDPAYKKAVGDRSNAPPGYRYTNPDDPNSSLSAIPGGPAEKVDAEVAARLGMTESFLEQLPAIRERVKAGEATGPIDAAFASRGAGVPAWLGGGNPGELRRMIDSGVDALLRNLTGAGMSQSEAKEYERRYRVQWDDSAETVLSKLNQLERELRSVQQTVGKGRGGASGAGGAGPTGGAPAAGPQGQQLAPQQFREGQTATNPRTGQKLMFRGGQWVPAQ